MQTTRTVVEWNGAAYHALSDMQYDLAMELLRPLPLRGDEALIDAGCGSGRITAELLRRVPRGSVLGVDLGSSMLDQARAVVRPAAGQSVSFVQANLQQFRAAAPADGIFSNMALHFVRDHRVMFQNFAASLRPGGWLALQYGAAQMAQRMRSTLMGELNRPPLSEYIDATAFDFHGGDPERTPDDLAAAGFVDCRVEPFEAATSGATRDKMVAYFRDELFVAVQHSLPDPALRAEVGARMQASLHDLWEQPFSFLRVRARLPEAH